MEYVYEPGGPTPYKCGYCKSQNTSMTQGVWGYKMTCQDYQDLVDRGFQRSGKFVYRPAMKRTCCPQYVIRMDVTKFKTSKSQRRVVKKFNRYLTEGKTHKETPDTTALSGSSPASGEGGSHSNCEKSCAQEEDAPSPSKRPSLRSRVVKPGVGADASKPPSRKAKLLRKEKKAKKLAALTQARMDDGASLRPRESDTTKMEPSAPQAPEFQETLSDLLTLPQSENSAHRFGTRLVRVTPSSEEFIDTYSESYEVFKKFQMQIHNEKEADCTPKHFEEFLVQTPLANEPGGQGMPHDYGTYHQQYLLDGKIFAVGVLDILPKGVLCEYLYYNPEFRFIAPGVYTALQEIALAQRFYARNPAMQYYYMGFYVQSCPKMNYKSKYNASSLLCPETYQYVALERCVPKLLASGYSRLAEDSVADVNEIFSAEELLGVPVMSDMTAMTYASYRTLYGDVSRELMEEYVKLVGLGVAGNMRLFMSRRFQF